MIPRIQSRAEAAPVVITSRLVIRGALIFTPRTAGEILRVSAAASQHVAKGK